MQTRNLLSTLLLLVVLLVGATACSPYTTTPGIVVAITPKGFSTTHVPESDDSFQLSNNTASSVTLCVVQNAKCEADPSWFDPNQQSWVGGFTYLPTLHTLLPHFSQVFDIDGCSPPDTYTIAIVQQGYPTAQRLEITDMISCSTHHGEGG